LSENDGNFYTGSTKDLRRRLEEHNSGKVESTFNRRPFKLIYYEACISEDDARKRERYLKSGMGKKYLRNRLKDYLDNLYGMKVMVGIWHEITTMSSKINMLNQNKCFFYEYGK